MRRSFSESPQSSLSVRAHRARQPAFHRRQSCLQLSDALLQRFTCRPLRLWCCCDSGRLPEASERLVRDNQCGVCSAFWTSHGPSAARLRLVDLAMTTYFDDVAPVKAYTPTHELIVGRRSCIDDVPRTPDAFASCLTQLGVGRLLGPPLRGPPLDIDADTFRRLLILVISSGQLIRFESRALTPIVDIAAHKSPCSDPSPAANRWDAEGIHFGVEAAMLRPLGGQLHPVGRGPRLGALRQTAGR